MIGEMDEAVATVLAAVDRVGKRDRLAAWRERVGAAMPRLNPEPVDPYGPRGLPSGPR